MVATDDDKFCRVEIDTSAPIESVKDAANLFGGIGYWKPQLHRRICPESDFEEQAAELEKEMLKERETLDVLEELEKTKCLVEELKTRLQKETSELNLAMEAGKAEQVNKVGGVLGIPSSAPGFVLLELKRAKANLVKTTNDLSQLRSNVELYTERIEEERKALEVTRESLALNTSEVLCLEKDLDETREKLQLVKHEDDAHEAADQIAKELQRLSTEADEFKKVGEAAKSEVLKAMSDIEMTKAKLHTMEMRLKAAQKTKEAARASEAIAIADVKALTNVEDDEEVTLSVEEYSLLKSKTQEAEDKCNVKVEDAMVLVDEANLSKMEILRRVKEATEEVKNSKLALEEVLHRVEAANKDKRDLQRSLRKKRSESYHRRRSVHKSGKFKHSSQNQNRRKKVCGLHDVKELHISLKSEWSEPAKRPTLSIGQILSQKLLHPAEDDAHTLGHQPDENTVPDVSLRELLNINKSENVSKSTKPEDKSGEKQLCAKRKTFGLGRLSILLSKHSKKKKTIPSFKHCTGKTNPHDRLSFG